MLLRKGSQELFRCYQNAEFQGYDSDGCSENGTNDDEQDDCVVMTNVLLVNATMLLADPLGERRNLH